MALLVLLIIGNAKPRNNNTMKIFVFKSNYAYLIMCFLSLLVLGFIGCRKLPFDSKIECIIEAHSFIGHKADGSLRRPYLLLIEQRNMGSLVNAPASELKMQTLLDLDAAFFARTEEVVEAGGEKMKLITSLYEYEPLSKPYTLDGRSYMLLPVGRCRINTLNLKANK